MAPAKWLIASYLETSRIDTLLGNIKTAIVGTLKSFNRCYVFHYFGEFQYRFNRRLKLPAMLDRLTCVVARSKPRYYNPLAVAEDAR